MTDIMDESEFWMSEDDDAEDAGAASANATLFQLDLERVGEDGDFRTQGTEPQRKVVTGCRYGSKKRPAFFVGCVAQAIIHGTLDQTTGTRATLLVYDFSFFSYRRVRIKAADIYFEFRSNDGIAGAGPLVDKIAPLATHTMMETTSLVTRTWETSGVLSGGTVVHGEAGGKYGKTVENTETYAAELTGNMEPDNWGNHFEVYWSLEENQQQPKGIVRQMRTCILLTRKTDKEFQLVPTITATPNFPGWLGSLRSTRPPDDPVTFDPGYEPYNQLGVTIDRWNLDKVSLESLWDCTFHHSFGNAIKASKAGASMSEEVKGGGGGK